MLPGKFHEMVWSNRFKMFLLFLLPFLIFVLLFWIVYGVNNLQYYILPTASRMIYGMDITLISIHTSVTIFYFV